MQRFIALISLAVIIGASSSIVFAQADAAAAFEQGRAAYASGQWTSARDLFLKASHTDTRNPVSWGGSIGGTVQLDDGTLVSKRRQRQKAPKTSQSLNSRADPRESLTTLAGGNE